MGRPQGAALAAPLAMHHGIRDPLWLLCLPLIPINFSLPGHGLLVPLNRILLAWRIWTSVQFTNNPKHLLVGDRVTQDNFCPFFQIDFIAVEDFVRGGGWWGGDASSKGCEGILKNWPEVVIITAEKKYISNVQVLLGFQKLFSVSLSLPLVVSFV